MRRHVNTVYQKGHCAVLTQRQNSFAPGTDIVSITSSSNDATDTLTGTSMAAPRKVTITPLLVSSYCLS